MSPGSTKNRLNKKQKSVDIFVDENKNYYDNYDQIKQNTSLQIDLNQDTLSTLSLNCNCDDHVGKLYLNQTFNLNIDYLFECLFGSNEFSANFFQQRKITDIKQTDWKIENEIRVKQIEYKIGISGVVGSKFCNNIDCLKIIKLTDNEIYIDSETLSSGVPYADCFKVCSRYCLIKCPSRKRTKLIIHSTINYISKPNFIIKNLIDKNCFSNLTGHFTDLEKHLNIESESGNKIASLTISEQINKLNIENNYPTSSPSISCSAQSSSSSSVVDSSDNENSSDSDVQVNKNTPSNFIPTNTIKYRQVNTVIKNNCNDMKKNHDISPFLKKVNMDKNEQVTNSSHRINSQLYSLKQNYKSNLQNNQFNQSYVNNETLNYKCTYCMNMSHNNNYDSGKKSFIICKISSDVFIKFFFLIMILLIILNGFIFAKLTEIEHIAYNIKKNSKFAQMNSN